MFTVRQYYYLITLLLFSTWNVYAVRLPKEYILTQNNESPQRYWYNKIAVEHIKINPNIDGGISQEDPNNIKYYELAKESLEKYIQDTGAKQHHVLNVTKATEQVVAGLMTRIDFDAVPTNSELDQYNAPTSRNNGVNVYDNNIITCHSEIWSQPWINTKIIEVNCWE